MFLALLLACAPDDVVEPLALPEDPAAWGVPVGARTLESNGQTIEIWYPASDRAAGDAGETVDVTPYIPDSVQALIGPLSLPGLDTRAVRDAALRPPVEPYPLVLFSHGFGGFRTQSVDLTTHLASRGYVVAAPDHPGRMLGDVLPCLFSPPAEGCDLTGFTSDPGPEDLAAALAALASEGEDGFLAGAVRLDDIGVMGHSAGAGSTTAFGAEEPSAAALLPMAGGAPVPADIPTFFMEGTCDPFPGIESVTASYQASADAHLLAIAGAGHLAFSDICELELGAMAEQHLLDREDLNPAFVDGLLALATDGCPDATPDPEAFPDCAGFLDLDVSSPILRHYETVFFDEALKGHGDGPQAGAFAEVALE